KSYSCATPYFVGLVTSAIVFRSTEHACCRGSLSEGRPVPHHARAFEIHQDGSDLCNLTPSVPRPDLRLCCRLSLARPFRLAGISRADTPSRAAVRHRRGPWRLIGLADVGMATMTDLGNDGKHPWKFPGNAACSQPLSRRKPGPAEPQPRP